MGPDDAKVDDEPQKANEVMLSSLILHRALAIQEENSWNSNTYLADVLYLAVLLEQFVLHDNLVILDYPNVDEEFLHETGFGRSDEKQSLTNRLSNSPLLGKLLETGAIEIVEPDFEYISDEIMDVLLGTDDEKKWDDECEFEAAEVDVDVYVAQKIVDMRYAFDWNCSYIPDQSGHCKMALSYLKKQNAFHVSLLSRSYERLSKDLREDILRLVKAGSNKKIFLPPIPAIILNRATGIEDVVEKGIELRGQFADLRAQFTEYEMKICDDSLPIRESLEALNQLDAALNIISPPTEKSLATAITEWRDLTDVSKVLDGLTSDEAVSLIKTGLGVPLKVIAQKLKTRKVSYLSVMRKDFLNILIQRVFGHDISHYHIQSLRSSVGKGFADYILK